MFVHHSLDIAIQMIEREREREREREILRERGEGGRGMFTLIFLSEGVAKKLSLPVFMNSDCSGQDSNTGPPAWKQTISMGKFFRGGLPYLYRRNTFLAHQGKLSRKVGPNPA